MKKPHEKKIDFQSGGYAIYTVDVRPELRLAVLVSVADTTGSNAALEAAIHYVDDVMDVWAKREVDFSDATTMLRTLDEAKLPDLFVYEAN